MYFWLVYTLLVKVWYDGKFISGWINKKQYMERLGHRKKRKLEGEAGMALSKFVLRRQVSTAVFLKRSFPQGFFFYVPLDMCKVMIFFFFFLVIMTQWLFSVTEKIVFFLSSWHCHFHLKVHCQVELHSCSHLRIWGKTSTEDLSLTLFSLRKLLLWMDLCSFYSHQLQLIWSQGIIDSHF